MSEEERPKTPAENARREPRGRAWVYFVLLVGVPGALWAAAAVVPFLPVGTATKVWLVPGFLVLAEVVFWGAALFLGREIVARYRRYFDPRNWFRGDGTGR